MKKIENPTELVKEHIFNQLELHNLKIGDRLPTELQLAEQLGVSRSFVRDALQALKSNGLVTSSQGSGYTIIGDAKKSFSEALRTIITIYNITFTDISEIREALEIKAAQLAIQKTIPSEDISFLEHCIEQMKTYSRTDSSQVPEYDIEFHKKIAELSGNPFLINFVLALSDFSNKYILISWDKVDDGEITELLETHRNIIYYLKTENSSAVTTEVSRHYHIADNIIKNHQPKEDLKQLLDQLYQKGFTADEIRKQLLCNHK